MNIWILNHYAVTPDLPGGTRHYNLGRQLIKQGYDVTVFASSFHYVRHEELKLSRSEHWKIEESDGVKFVWLRTFPYQENDWRRVVNMLSYMIHSYLIGCKITRMDDRISRPDVVIGSSVHLLAVLSAYYLAKHCGAKFIMEVRDLWPQTIIDMGVLSEQSPTVKILHTLERFLYHRAERIITLLPLAGEYIAPLGISKEKITWIPNGVDLSYFSGQKGIESSNEPFRVMYLGAHGQANALDVLLNAAKIVQDRGYQSIRFTLVGDGPEKPRLMELAQELELENVGFRNPIPKSKVPEVLTKADILIFNLEKAEVFKYGVSSNKLFDYMAAGKPVIFSVQAPNNPIEEAHCGLTVPPRDPQALAEAVIKLYQMPIEEQEAMGQRGREYAKEHHDYAVLAEKLIACIEEVMAKQRRAV